MDHSVLLVTVDCLRPDHLQAYGYYRETAPNIDAIADDGTLFENAFSNGPGTRFAFKSINAGVFPLRISGAGLPQTADQTVAEALSSAGYRTAGFANNPFLTTRFNHHRGFDTFLEVSDWENGQDPGAISKVNSIAGRIHQQLSGGIIHKSLRRVYERLLTVAESRGASVGINDKIVVDKATDWIRKREDDSEPYYAWVHLMDVHGPHQYLSSERKELGIKTDHIRDPTGYVTESEKPPQAVIDTYDASLRHADKQIGRLLETVSPDTTIILTADHGEEFGRHGGFHEPSTYQSMAHVPLIVHGEKFDAARKTEPVSHVDMAATIVDLSGAELSGQWDGGNLLEDTGGQPTQFLGFENEDGVFGAAVSYPYKYILKTSNLGSSPSKQLLFDLKDDPNETDDKSVVNPDILESLRKEWVDHVSNVQSYRIEAEHDIWDPSNNHTDETDSRSNDKHREIENQLKHLGYK